MFRLRKRRYLQLPLKEEIFKHYRIRSWVGQERYLSKKKFWAHPVIENNLELFQNEVLRSILIITISSMTNYCHSTTDVHEYPHDTLCLQLSPAAPHVRRSINRKPCDCQSINHVQQKELINQLPDEKINQLPISIVTELRSASNWRLTRQRHVVQPKQWVSLLTFKNIAFTKYLYNV